MKLFDSWGDAFLIRLNDRGNGWNAGLIECTNLHFKDTAERKGSTTVYTGETITKRLKDDPDQLRIVFNVTTTEVSGYKVQLPGYTIYQPPLWDLPDTKVFAVWTNITDAEVLKKEDALQIYRNRGTCEQFIGEIKTDLSAERLPARKFSTNKLVFALIVYSVNLLRLIGKHLLGNICKNLVGVDRRRLKTIIQYFMYMPGRIVKHARKTILKVHGYFEEISAAFCECYNAFAKLI
jgi:hypothetical protein